MRYPVSWKLAAAATAALTVGWVAGASAAPIAAGSILNIVGAAGFTSTAINFSNPESVTSGNTGSFAAFAPCTGCVTMTTPLVYNPFTPGQIYTATSGALTTTFNITSPISVTSFSSGGFTFLVVADAGTATLTGYSPTPGDWSITLNEQTGTVNGSFSATTIAIPEPASLALMGAGLTGIGLLRRRSRRDASSLPA